MGGINTASTFYASDMGLTSSITTRASCNTDSPPYTTMIWEQINFHSSIGGLSGSSSRDSAAYPTEFTDVDWVLYRKKRLRLSILWLLVGMWKLDSKKLYNIINNVE